MGCLIGCSMLMLSSHDWALWNGFDLGGFDCFVHVFDASRRGEERAIKSCRSDKMGGRGRVTIRGYAAGV